MHLKLHFNIWVIVLSALIAVGCLLAFAVPQWHVFYPASFTIGLHRQCQGNDCQGIQYPQQFTWPSGCQRNGNELKDRIAASAAFLWIAFIVMVVFAVVLVLAVIFACFRLEGMLKCILFCVTAVVSGVLLLISIAIYTASFNNWIACDESYCTAYKSIPGNGGFDCGYGASLILTVFALLCYWIVGALCFIRVLDCSFKHRQAIEIALLIFTGCGIFFNIMGGAMARWLVISLDPISIGLFQNCQDTDCQSNDYSGQIGSGVNCRHEGHALGDRYKTVAAFTFIVFIMAVCLLVLYILRACKVLKMRFEALHKILVMVFVGVMIFFLFLAIVIYGATMDSWYFCGTDFCDQMSQGGASCTYGFCFAVALICFFLCFAILILLLVEFFRCCNCGGRLTYVSDDYYYESSMSRSTQQTEVYDSSSGGGTYYRKETTTTTYSSSSRQGPLFPEGGDWVWDDGSGYYWSDRRQKYWDKPSDQFYDPNTGIWTDARTPGYR